MTPADFLRDYLSKWGPEMDADEYDGMQRCLDALNTLESAVAAEREACAKIAEDGRLLADAEYYPDAIASAIRARSKEQA